ncbi:MAG: hypothetical protein ACI93L_003016 [Cyclobacteriaceae bacterium]|jgi:hypothetical protein
MPVGLRKMKKPENNEYAPFYQGYVEAVPEGDLLSFLKNQKIQLLSLFSDLSKEDLDYAYAKGKWTVGQVLGHIIDVERVMSYRALCISRGDSQSLPGFDQDEYVETGKFINREIASFKMEFEGLRLSNIALFESFSDAEFDKRGIASGVTFSVRALIFITAGHVQHHLNILSAKYNIQ